MPYAEPSEEAVPLEGLAASAEILIDRWGIPHIRAESLDDLFLAQGFNAARDRLWQIDLWRKRGLGLLAADFGPGYLAQDRAARLFLYRGDMAAEWAAYGPDAERICERFAAGINAFIGLAEREPDRLPPEFALMGTRPQRWRAEDVVRIRSHGLTRNALSEVLRAAVLARADLATDRLRYDLDPPVTPHRAEGLDLGALAPAALDVFRLAGAPVTFAAERLAAPLSEAWTWGKLSPDGAQVVREEAVTEGSNNWVVHGSRTATGRPILASDPHRAHAIPSLRYLVHLTAPGFDAIGGGEPSAPGVSIGHNGTIAFGLTIFPADQEDVYVYETEAGRPDAYRYGGGWEAMQVVEERFAVRGAPDQLLPLRFTRHGPVVAADGKRAVAIRTAWSEPGSAPYLASLAAMRARDLDGFRRAMRGWGAPTANQVYADISGTIAWFPVGAMPKRPNWEGLLPVPGDGRYEWDGFIGQDRLPCVVDPPEGFVATANERNLPADWPHHELPVGFEWTDPSRANRIKAVLRAQERHGIEQSRALQTDVASVVAERLGRLVDGLPEGAVETMSAAALLGGWDHRVVPESGAAALFEVWWSRHLPKLLLERLVADEGLRALLFPVHATTLLALLEAPDARFGADPRAGRDLILADSLAAAWRDTASFLGADPAGWQWGTLHKAYFEHALTGLEAGRAASLDAGPLPIGGATATPMYAGYRATDFRLTTGASVRLVMDVGDWDRSVCINAPGQSGDPRSPHYRDLMRVWAAGDYVPMLYSEAAVRGAAARRILLRPAGGPG